MNIGPGGQKDLQTRTGATLSVIAVLLMVVYLTYAIDIVWNRDDQ